MVDNGLIIQSSNLNMNIFTVHVHVSTLATNLLRVKKGKQLRHLLIWEKVF